MLQRRVLGRLEEGGTLTLLGQWPLNNDRTNITHLQRLFLEDPNYNHLPCGALFFGGYWRAGCTLSCCVVPIKDETDAEWDPDGTSLTLTPTWTLTTTPPLLQPRVSECE